MVGSPLGRLDDFRQEAGQFSVFPTRIGNSPLGGVSKEKESHSLKTASTATRFASLLTLLRGAPYSSEKAGNCDAHWSLFRLARAERR